MGEHTQRDAARRPVRHPPHREERTSRASVASDARLADKNDAANSRTVNALSELLRIQFRAETDIRAIIRSSFSGSCTAFLLSRYVLLVIPPDVSCGSAGRR